MLCMSANFTKLEGIWNPKRKRKFFFDRWAYLFILFACSLAFIRFRSVWMGPYSWLISLVWVHVKMGKLDCDLVQRRTPHDTRFICTVLISLLITGISLTVPGLVCFYWPIVPIRCPQTSWTRMYSRRIRTART